jgi:methylated-DNA-[protein]-cysteine S-methyltransferase
MKYALCETTVSWVGIGIDDGAICAIELASTRRAALEALTKRGYFEPAGEREAKPFVHLVRRAAAGKDVLLNGQLRLVGGTKFQRAVWQAMRSIPLGGTVSYGELARKAGNPGAARAVGQAVGHNPIPLLIPCHRVIASVGTLGGFGGGPTLKRALLKVEGITL